MVSLRHVNLLKEYHGESMDPSKADELSDPDLHILLLYWIETAQVCILRITTPSCVVG